MSGSVLLLVISIVLLVLCIGAAAVSVFFIIRGARGSAGAGVSCPSCGAKQRAGTKFCSECGAPLPISRQAFCTECGTRYEAGMAFCPNCGKAAEAAAPAPAKRSKAPVIAACASVVMMIPLIVLIAVSSADLGSSSDYIISDRYDDDDYHSRRDRDESSDNGGYNESSYGGYEDNGGYGSYSDYDSSYSDNGGYDNGGGYVPAYTSCLKCHGTGICPVCYGRGGMSYNTYGQDDDGWVECAACHGGRLCPRCNGTGRE